MALQTSSGPAEHRAAHAFAAILLVPALLGSQPLHSPRPSHEEAKLTASDGHPNDDFGYSVALSGATAVVGADTKNHGTGAAYVFVRSGGVWTQQAKLVASDGARGDGFGVSVAISGSIVLVGAPGRASYEGAAYVFVRANGAWSQQAELTASDGETNDSFGVSVAIDAGTAVIGAYNTNDFAGSAYVFGRSHGTWTERQEINASDTGFGDGFGYSVALAGSTAAAGAPFKNDGSGVVYVFERVGGSWLEHAELGEPHPRRGDSLGSSVALSGQTLLAGAPLGRKRKGAAFVFTRTTSGWAQQQELIASEGKAFDAFGSALALVGDTAAVGAWYANMGVGAGFVFTRSDGTWIEDQTLVASDGVPGDGLGWSAAMSGSTVLLGARGWDDGSGAAYVFGLGEARPGGP